MKQYLIPSLALLTGLGLSITSGYYSIVGLLTIFSTGIIGFILLEIAKITSTLYVHHYWQQLSGLIRVVIVAVVITLSAITSGGVYGYYSKAALGSGEEIKMNSSKISQLESGLQLEQRRYDQTQKQIDRYVDLQEKLITVDPLKANRERRRLQQEVTKLTVELKEIAVRINELSEEIQPYKQSLSKHEVEIGPLLFITKAIYGEQYESHTDSMLSNLILVISLIFDPLAIGLLLMAQQGFRVASRANVSKSVEHIDETEGVKVAQTVNHTPDDSIQSTITPEETIESEYLRELVKTAQAINSNGK